MDISFGDWAEGYSAAELSEAQERFHLTFPPDLVELLLERRPARGLDWRGDDQAIRRALAWPFEGLLFDVEQAGLWWPEWGERPDDEGGRADVLRDVVARAPPLVPVLGHRYIPSEPAEAGNPVFSVVQSDIVYYGVDLEDYFEREFGSHPHPLSHEPKSIRFWSLMVERAHQTPFYPTVPDR